MLRAALCTLFFALTLSGCSSPSGTDSGTGGGTATAGGAAGTGGGSGANGGGTATGGGSACAAPGNGLALFPLTDVNGPDQGGTIHSGDGDNVVRQIFVMNGKVFFNSQDSVHSVSVDGGTPTTVFRSRGTTLDSPAVETPFGVRKKFGMGLAIKDDKGWMYSTIDDGTFMQFGSLTSGIYDVTHDAVVFAANLGSATAYVRRDGVYGSGTGADSLYTPTSDELVENFFVNASNFYFRVRSATSAFAPAWKVVSLSGLDPQTGGTASTFAPNLGANIEMNAVLFAEDDSVYVSATDMGATTQGDGIYRITGSSAPVQVVRTQALTVDTASNADKVVFNIAGDFYVVSKTATAPATKWFTASTRTFTCLSYGVAVDSTTMYSSMYDTGSKQTTVYKVPLP